MACCQKCGKGNLKNRKSDHKKKCRRCGFLPNGKNLDRSGNLTTENYHVNKEK